jgi:hypothetical protein
MPKLLRRREFSLDNMNRVWDLSNESYVSLIEKQWQAEAAQSAALKREHPGLITIIVGPKQQGRQRKG